MGGSNAEWGALAEHDSDAAELWDKFENLPDEGENEALDAFCDKKRITISSLVRMGARITDHTKLAFVFGRGMKYRDIVTDARDSYKGSDWSLLKIIPHDSEPSEVVIVAEGETDAARLSDNYPCDVAVMAAGAEYFPPSYTEALSHYKRVLVGIDTDAAGVRGAAKIMAALPHAERFAPPANDWCLVDELPPIPPEPERRIEAELLVSAGDMLSLEPPAQVSWFENALLPVGGQLILHGWVKSYKSFLALDMAAALAQGQPWATFEPTEEPCRVAVMQYEIPWAYFQQRIRMLRACALEPELFDHNFLSWQPLIRPRFRAGITEHEDLVLKTLVDGAVQVFVLDPIRRATGAADLNNEADLAPLHMFIERLQAEGITVITCHHDNKSSARSGGGDPLGMTGSGVFAGNSDTIVSVSLPKGCVIEEPKRNLHFTLRNAPAPGSRGMEMTEAGHIAYQREPHGLGMADDTSGPSI